MRLLFLISSYVFLGSSLASARLAPVSWSEFNKSAELIVHGTPLKMEWGEVGAGFALFKVVKVLRGDLKDDTVAIRWSSEVHDQAITDMGVDRLLFLKKDKESNWGAAIYGRSYWPLWGRTIDSSKIKDYNPKAWSACVSYPLTMIQFSPKEKQTFFGHSQYVCPSRTDFISVEKLSKALIDAIR